MIWLYITLLIHREIKSILYFKIRIKTKEKDKTKMRLLSIILLTSLAYVYISAPAPVTYYSRGQYPLLGRSRPSGRPRPPGVFF